MKLYNDRSLTSRTKQIMCAPLAGLAITSSLIGAASAATVCCNPTFSCNGSLAASPEPDRPLLVGPLCEGGGIDSGAGYANWSPLQGSGSTPSARVYNPSTIDDSFPFTTSSDYISMKFSPAGSGSHCLATGEDDSGNSVNSNVNISFGAAVSSGSTFDVSFHILAAYSINNGASFTELGYVSINQNEYNGIDEQDATFGASNVPGWNVSRRSNSWGINTGVLDPGQSIEVRFFFGVNEYRQNHTGSWTDDSNVKAVFIESVSAGNICSIQAIPEPSSTLLLGLGGISLILRRKRTSFVC